MADRKKTIERGFLNRVLSAIDKGSPSEVTDDEEPDFIVRFGATCVGVEVTRLHHPPTLRGSRAWEGACEAVLKAAQEIWETRDLPRVYTNVRFNKDIHFPKNRWAIVVEKLVACVHQALPSVGRGAVVGLRTVGGLEPPPWLSVNVECPAEVDHIIISRDASLPRTWWTITDQGSPLILT